MMAEAAARGATAAARSTADHSEEQLPVLAWSSMEGLIRANQVLVDGTSELSHAWFTCWQEQFAEGMELTREVLERQGMFVRTSLERMTAQATRSVEVTSGMVDGYFAPLRESAVAEQTPKQVV